MSAVGVSIVASFWIGFTDNPLSMLVTSQLVTNRLHRTLTRTVVFAM